MAVLIVVSTIGLMPVIYNAVKALFRRHLTIDLLASVALIFSLLAHEWTSAVFISLMLAAARLFARYAGNKAKKAVQSLLKLRPTKAHLLRDGKIIETPIEEIKIGDEIVVESGERAAIDGIIVSGQASIDQSSLTGESELIVKAEGDEVLSSTLNISGSLVVRAERVGQDTTFSKILQLVEKSQTSKSAITSTVDRFAAWYIFLTLVGSAALFFWTGKAVLVLSILLVTCADDLAVAVPLAFTAAIGVIARRGIIVKGGEFLEGLTKIKTMIFDKTGTITQGKPQIEKVVVFGDVAPEEFLALLGATESESEHPTAEAIDAYVVAKKIKMPLIIKVHEEPGFGIMGRVGNDEVLAGKTKFLKDQGVVFLPEQLQLIEEQKLKHLTITVLGKNKKALGFVAMADAIRPAAAEVMKKLKEQGVEKLIMLTGDNEKIAAEVAGRVGIDEFRANLLPQDKIDFLKTKLNPKDKVAMVGDGVNDAAALAAADIGIAMGAIGSDAAIESADIVLMKDRLSSIPETISLSHYTLKIIRQDLWLWAAVNAVGLILVFGGVLNPSGAAAYNFLSDFLPILNSLRIFRFHNRFRQPSFEKEPVFDTINS